MRQVLVGLLIVAATLWRSTPLPTQSAPRELTGRVVTGSGPDVRPVRRATVTLNGASGQPRIVDTDADGGYRFDRLPPGEYSVSVKKAGFVTRETSASPDATLTLDRAGAIEGAIADVAGDPIWNVPVSVLRLGPDHRPQPIGTTRTDDLGRYRLHTLPPGDYYVEAASDEVFLNGRLLLPGERRPNAVRSFYPAGSTIEEARPVRVSLGQETTGVDLTLRVPPSNLLPPWRPPGAFTPFPGRSARITGRVQDAVSGKPIRSARLLLIAERGGGSLTQTDGTGRFSFESLGARRYTLKAEADRYVSLEFGQQHTGETGMAIDLENGQEFIADLRLPRATGIEGQILDEFGEPVPNIAMRLVRKQYADGRQRLLPAGNSLAPVPSGGFVGVGPAAAMSALADVRAPVTDDRGRYRIPALPPGEYFIEALPGAFAGTNEAGGFAPTYYPGTTDAMTAAPVPVELGADTTASFALVPARTVAVSGVMIDADGRPVAGGSVSLSTPDRLERPDVNVARSSTGPDGRFRLRNVPAGSYTLQGFGPPSRRDSSPNQPPTLFGWLSLSVGDSDLDDVPIRVTGGMTLRGKVVLEDAPVPPPTANEVRVTAIPVEFDSAPLGGSPPPSDTRADLSFEITRLSGVRRILVTVTSPNWTVKQIRLNEIDISDASVDLRTHDVDGVEVVLSPKVSRVSGKVSGEKGPITGYAIVIFPSDRTKWFDRSRFVRLERSTQQGWFDARGLPPEDYLVIALPNVVGNEWQDPEFLEQLRGQATPFVLTEGESRTLELKLRRRP